MLPYSKATIPPFKFEVSCKRGRILPKRDRTLSREEDEVSKIAISKLFNVWLHNNTNDWQRQHSRWDPQEKVQWNAMEQVVRHHRLKGVTEGTKQGHKRREKEREMVGNQVKKKEPVSIWIWTRIRSENPIIPINRSIASTLAHKRSKILLQHAHPTRQWPDP